MFCASLPRSCKHNNLSLVATQVPGVFVQHQAAPVMAEQAHLRHDYWKIQAHSHLSVEQIKDVLNKRGAQIISDASEEQLRRQLQRSELGLLHYAQCSDDEMRGFIRARGLEVSRDSLEEKDNTREELIDTLEQADDQRTFAQFFELPGEMRNRVYTAHFADFEQPLYEPSQPPIAHASKQLRAETLKLFYSECNFRVARSITRSSHESWEHVAVELIGCITKLHIGGTHKKKETMHAQYGPRPSFRSVSITLNEQGSGYKINYTLYHDTEQEEFIPDWAVKLLHEVQNLCQGIMIREGKRRLLPEDILHFTAAYCEGRKRMTPRHCGTCRLFLHTGVLTQDDTIVL